MTCSVRNQRGFTMYAILGLAAVAAGLGIALVVQNARLDAAHAELAGCKSAYEQTLKLVEKQNQAVKAHQEATKKATERARLASEKAAKAKVASQSEIRRLESLAGQPAPKGDCPAGQAVQEIRKGLKR